MATEAKRRGAFSEQFRVVGAMRRVAYTALALLNRRMKLLLFENVLVAFAANQCLAGFEQRRFIRGVRRMAGGTLAFLHRRMADGTLGNLGVAALAEGGGFLFQHWGDFPRVGPVAGQAIAVGSGRMAGLSIQ